MIGNFVVGTSVLAPTGMLNELASDVAGSTHAAGLLVTWGAVVMCVGSPVMSGVTSRIDRRTLLGGGLLLMAIGHLASAFAPDYGSLLAIRILMVVAAAPFTPQAASTIALLVPAAERASAISFVFLGWSLSVAAGLPIIKLLAAQIGWRASFGALAGVALVAFVLVAWSLPAGLRGTAVSLKSWAAIGRHRQIRLILLLTAVLVAGQFAVFTFLAPLLVDLCEAGTATITTFFLVFGAMGFAGNVVATRIVSDLGPLRTTFAFLVTTLAGITLWSVGAGAVVVMGVGIALWGLGFAAINSMQQARLVAAEPALSAGTVALNTSAIYIGQATGSAVGGFLMARGLPLVLGYAAMASTIVGMILLAYTRSPGEPFPWRRPVTPPGRSAS
jgi:MFS transporter, DHA1 family, inner membrane transport protein